MKLNTTASAAEPGRHGTSQVDVMVGALVVAILFGIGVPWALHVREGSRNSQCAVRLQQIGLALQSYHDAHAQFPAAAVWSTQRMQSLALHLSKRHDLFVQSNWASALLPHLDREELANQFDDSLPVASDSNRAFRTTHVTAYACPSDSYTRLDNPFSLETSSTDAVEYARGNYAINGGTHNHQHGPGSTKSPTGDHSHLVMDREEREYRFWGNGIAGINQHFSLDEFANGQSTLVAVEEVRAGIHSIDPRGVWSLGHIASSITWAHGINGDAYGPNNQWPRSDDIQGCGELHDTLGSKTLRRERMPCVSYLDYNQNATARSQHSGGVNVLFVDGHVRFVSDDVDPSLWHVLHSRETPSELLDDSIDVALRAGPVGSQDSEHQSSSFVHDGKISTDVLANSQGMEFSLIPAGEFIMGLPDQNNDQDLPAEVPSHSVRISNSYWLGRHEVTLQQFRHVTGSIPDYGHLPTGEITDDYPVSNVSWNEARNFCKLLSEVPEEADAGRSYRLPTEAEWEYACRAGETGPFAFRWSRLPSDRSGIAAGTTPPLAITGVGSYRPNAFGIYDMRGNVWEWCNDWFDREYYSRAPKASPQGPASGYFKVIRGSDWIFVGEGCKINYPIMQPWKRNLYVGFRVVCERETLAN